MGQDSSILERKLLNAEKSLEEVKTVLNTLYRIYNKIEDKSKQDAKQIMSEIMKQEKSQKLLTKTIEGYKKDLKRIN